MLEEGLDRRRTSEGVNRPGNVYVAADRRLVADRLWKFGDAVNVFEGAENNTR